MILPVSWETCMQVKKQQLKTGHWTMDWFKIRKGVCQGYILSPCLFNLYAEFTMWNAGLDELQAGIKNDGRNINNLRYVDDTTLMAESKEELKSLLMRVKEESEKVDLKKSTFKNLDHGIWSHHFMGNRWGKCGNNDRFYFGGGLKITMDGDCHEIKRLSLLGKNVMTNLESILKSRDITLPTKVHIVKAMIFLIVMYWCESWT